MNPVKSCLLVVPGLALAASLAWVQPASSQNAAPRGAAGVTLDQFLARQTARIMAADTDGDGRISRAELAAMGGKGGGGKGGGGNGGPGKGDRDPARRFDAMDTNHDGYLDKDEITAALTRRFHRMDVNGDGVLTPDERMAARMRHNPQPPAGSSPVSPP